MSLDLCFRKYICKVLLSKLGALYMNINMGGGGGGAMKYGGDGGDSVKVSHVYKMRL